MPPRPLLFLMSVEVDAEEPAVESTAEAVEVEDGGKADVVIGLVEEEEEGSDVGEEDIGSE